MCRSAKNGQPGRRCATSKEHERNRKRKYRALKKVEGQIAEFVAEHGDKWTGDVKLSSMSSPKVAKALLFAYKAHEGVERKSGEPYVNHPLRVAKRLQDAGFDSNVICVAILHDAVEDSDLTLDDLREAGFNEMIVSGVDSVTKRDGEEYMDAVARASAHPIGRLVKLSDNLDNSSPEQLAPFNEERKLRAIRKYTPAKKMLRSVIESSSQSFTFTVRGSYKRSLLFA